MRWFRGWRDCVLSRLQSVGLPSAGGPLCKGFDGLAHLVRWQLGKELLDGDCFLFCSRSRTSAKVLLYDGTGLAIYCKRLEKGRFACLWKGPPGQPVALTTTELALFLEGCLLVGRQSLSPAEYRP